MNKDRGTIKWNAMMLPEHVKLLREWKQEDQLVTRPELDEWAMQDVSDQIQRAYEWNLTVQLTIWERTKLYKVSRKIIAIHPESQKVVLENDQKIDFSSIYGAIILG